MTRQNLFRLGVPILAMCAMLVANTGTSWADDPIILVVSKESPLTNIAKGKLRTLYLENKAIIGGKQYKPLNLKASNGTRKAFDKSLLGMTSTETSQYWADRKVKGKGLGPKEVSSGLKVQVTAYKTSSAVGYIRLSELKADKLKVLTIEGKAPTASGYLLR